MKTETWIDKSAWGDGPWQDEPDRVEWYVDDVPCLALRQPHSGHWCAYAAAPPGHPWHGKGYSCYADECDDRWDGCEHTLPSLNVHGGVTFAAPCAPKRSDRETREQVCHVPRAGEPDDVWWIGFDCHHAGDIAPGHEHRKSLSGLHRAPGGYQYRDLAYVQAETESVARQIIEAAS